MKRMTVVAAMLAAVLGLAVLAPAPAEAQSAWSFRGVTLTPRADWCPKQATQDGTAVLEVRPCGQDYPYLSMAIGREAGVGQPLDIDSLTATAANNSEGEETKARILGMAIAQYTACTTSSFRVDHAPIAGVSGFAIIATFACPSAPNGTVAFANFTAYAKQKNGAIWVVAFDYPVGPMTADDIAMIRSAIAAISASP